MLVSLLALCDDINKKKKQREKLHLEPAHDITGKQIAVFGAQRVN